MLKSYTPYNESWAQNLLLRQVAAPNCNSILNRVGLAFKKKKEELSLKVVVAQSG